ncbi:MAG: hypothetical protein M0P66_17955 [Salinivirgaceae bacterium]|nr:hypothetical protein [Salinivirgaceae bacterium]
MPIFLMAQSTDNSTNTEFSKGLGTNGYHLTIGSQVVFGSNHLFFMNHYINPTAKFDLTKKFSVIAGVGTSFTQFSGLPMLTSEGSITKTDMNITHLYAYAIGLYQLNPKLNLTVGAAVNQDFIKTESPVFNTTTNKYKDVMLGIDYKVSRHISFNAQMQFSDNPYRQYFHPFSHQTGFDSFGAFNRW